MLLGKGQKGTSHCVCVDCEEDWPYESKLQRVIEAALETEGVDVPCAVDVLITDDAGIHQANLETRGVDRPTDVLSFPMFELSPGEKPRAEWADPDTGKVFLGDMVISLERELCYLTVHSVLHLLGYDHLDEGPMKRQMREREEKILTEMGLDRT